MGYMTYARSLYMDTPREGPSMYDTVFAREGFYVNHSQNGWMNDKQQFISALDVKHYGPVEALRRAKQRGMAAPPSKMSPPKVQFYDGKDLYGTIDPIPAPWYPKEPTWAANDPMRPLEKPEIAEMKRMVGLIAYKPGTTIEFIDRGLYFYRPGIAIRMVVVDTEHHERPFELKANFNLRSNQHVRIALSYPEKFYDWVFRLLVWLEGHECGEFFKVAGEKTHDPHNSGYGSRYPRELESYPQFG